MLCLAVLLVGCDLNDKGVDPIDTGSLVVGGETDTDTDTDSDADVDEDGDTDERPDSGGGFGDSSFGESGGDDSS
jgi:hypothetical protein